MRIKHHFVSFTFIVSFSCLTAFWVNEFNLSFVKHSGGQLRNDETIRTADDKSYLSPVQTFLENGIWKENESGVNSYYKRSPGYGLTLLPHFALFSQKTALFSVKLFQCILHGMIAGSLWLCLIRLFSSKKFAVIISLFYGVFPLFYGYVFFTLTEALSVFLLFTLFFLLERSVIKNKYYNFLISCFVFSMLFLTRPVFGLFVFIPFAIIFKKRINWLMALLGFCICFLPYLLWMGRNVQISSRSMHLHPVYDSANNTVWRLPHQAIYELIKQYNPTPADFHDWNKKFWNAAQRQEDFKEIEGPTSIFNDRVVRMCTKDSLMRITNRYYTTLIEVPKQSATDNYSQEEMDLSVLFRKLKDDYARTYFLESHFKTPLVVLKKMIFTSNLNLQYFWQSSNNSSFVVFLRYVSGAVHSLLFILPCFGMLAFGKYRKRFAYVAVAISCYIFYLIYIQRGIENRYTFPLIAIQYYLSIVSLQYLLQHLFKRRNSRYVSTGD